MIEKDLNECEIKSESIGIHDSINHYGDAIFHSMKIKRMVELCMREKGYKNID